VTEEQTLTEPQGNEAKVCLVTGAAGFIGYHLCSELLARGFRVVGVDNLNDYYDVGLKKARLERLAGSRGFAFQLGDIVDAAFLESVFADHRPRYVVNLAAQAGVRYSMENPGAYVQSNVVGFFNVLETCRRHPIDHLLYASSSSVYGGNTKVPFEESDRVDHPLSLYAATKKADELMAHCYSHLYAIPATGLRFFTVYGPWGRPDMAYFSFVDSFFAGKPIRVSESGDPDRDVSRDFTYVDDVVQGLVRLLDRPPSGDPPHTVYNIGNSHPEKLAEFIATLEGCLSRSLGESVAFTKTFAPLMPGEVTTTFAATDRLDAAIGFQPATPLETGLQRFTDWYVSYKNLVGRRRV
jgi:UDP-glucuronate 4-epimerase